MHKPAAYPDNKSNPGLLAVIVVYKTLPCESSSLKTLLAASQASVSNFRLGIFVQDNTPGGQNPGTLPAQVRYEAAPHNPGLAHAYNRALEIAESESYDWILTLDQDTVLPSNLLNRIEELAGSLRSSPNIGAIVPRVVGDGRVLSPFRLLGGFLPHRFPPGFIGSPQEAVYAVNSASILNVAALQQIHGYDPLFPLDVSDLNLFHRLHRAGKGVFVAGDILVHHELAILKKRHRMTIERYQSILLDECAFWDLNLGFFARLERMMRLAGRACKESLESGDQAFRRATMSELKRRLGTSRAKRIAEWKQWAKARYMAHTEMAAAQSAVRTEGMGS